MMESNRDVQANDDGFAQPESARPGYRGVDSQFLSEAQAQALLRLVETAPGVQNRPQFFNWMQSHLRVLVPHVIAVCGAYDRGVLRVGFEVFHSLVLPRPLIDSLSGFDSSLMNRFVQTWVQGQGQPLTVELHANALKALGALGAELGKAGLTRIAVHGVARPSRVHEIETFYMFGDQTPTGSPGLRQNIELLMPHLHATYLRTRGLERDLTNPYPSAAPNAVDGVQLQLSKREREVLQWVREGRTNQQIGDQLGISTLTVKNHIQKILRKLGASNRAQAVATAMNGQMLSNAAGQNGGRTVPDAGPDGAAGK
jgi:transcriptional regulator EpsA